MQKELKYTLNNIISSYNYLAGSMSFIYSSGNDCSNWLVENFSSIKWRKLWNNLDFNKHNYKSWKCLQVDHRFIFKTKYLVNAIKDGIENDKYVYLFANEYYLEYSVDYLEKYFSHDLFIIGFDDAKELFTVLAYTKKLKFTKTQISYSSLIRAYKSCLTKYQIRYISLKKNFQFDTKLDNTIINANLQEYNCTMDKYIYKPMIQKIFKAIKMDAEIDFRSLRVFIEHKYVLSTWKKEYFAIYKEAENIMMLLMKYEAVKNTNLLDRILNYFEVMQRNEHILLQKLNL